MIKEPKLFRQFFSPKEIADFRQMISHVKNSPELKVDSDYFYRKYIHNPKALVPFHLFVSKFVSKFIKQELEPTYSFISMYGEGAGICPLHLDRPDCLLTLDVCVDQARPWPLYVNHTSPYRNEQDLVQHQETIKKESVEYILNPGDALFYSGTDHPHWRKQIDPDNFCELIFFHFKKAASGT
jgi:hypothetical protein